MELSPMYLMNYISAVIVFLLGMYWFWIGINHKRVWPFGLAILCWIVSWYVFAGLPYIK